MPEMSKNTSEASTVQVSHWTWKKLKTFLKSKKHFFHGALSS